MFLASYLVKQSSIEYLLIGPGKFIESKKLSYRFCYFRGFAINSRFLRFKFSLIANEHIVDRSIVLGMYIGTKIKTTLRHQRKYKEDDAAYEKYLAECKFISIYEGIISSCRRLFLN